MAKKNAKKKAPKDVNVLAKSIVDKATNEHLPQDTKENANLPTKGSDKSQKAHPH